MGKKLETETVFYRVCMSEYNEMNPYQDGDAALLADVATWMLATQRFGYEAWEEGHSEATEDALGMALIRLRYNPIQLAHFERLLSSACEALSGHLRSGSRMREEAARVEKTFDEGD
jgi:hypothetical protein